MQYTIYSVVTGVHTCALPFYFQPLRSNNYRTDCLNPAPSLLYPINAELPPFAEAAAIFRRAARAWPFRPRRRRLQRDPVDAVGGHPPARDAARPDARRAHPPRSADRTGGV